MSTRSPLYIPEEKWATHGRLVDTAIGGVIGGVAGLVLVAFGIGRALVAAAIVAARGDVVSPSADDARVVVAYVGAFVVGGALLGLARPLLRWHAAKVVAGAVVGALGMTVVAVAMEGGWSTFERSDLAVALAVGGGFGALGGLVVGSTGRTEQEFADLDRQVDEIDSHVAALRRSRERARQRRAASHDDEARRQSDAPPPDERSS